MLARVEASEEFKRELVSHLPNVQHYLCKLIKNVDLAEEMSQQTMLIALSSHNTYEAGTNMAAWLVTIARNQWLSTLRRDRGRWYELQDDWDNAVPASQESVLELKDVFRLMDRLPKKRRDALLVYAIGHKYEEVAKMVGLKPGTVKSTCSRARDRLMIEILGQHSDGAANEAAR